MLQVLVAVDGHWWVLVHVGRCELVVVGVSVDTRLHWYLRAC